MDFEKPLAELEGQIEELRSLQEAKGIDYSPEIRQLRSRLVKLTAKTYENLSGWETVQVARHARRPILSDYLDIMVKDFRELHGDRHFGDDRAMVTGFGRLGREKVMIVGQNKGRTTKEKIECNFAYAHPEGYRKALAKMKLAEKYEVPVVCLIDTPAAYPGIGAEERGQAQAIAVNMMEMSRLRVPIVCAIVGEGGSGGALGIGVGDRVGIMQFAYYSVIPPEGCAAILWRDSTRAAEAAEALKLTSGELYELGVVDTIVTEPLGGAHRNPHQAAHNLEAFLVKAVRDLKRCKLDNLLENRYQKLRKIGQMKLEGKKKAAKRTTKISGGIKEVPTEQKTVRKAKA